MILCSNPKAQYLAHKAEIDVAISRVLEKGWYILGEEVLAFENELSAAIGLKVELSSSDGESGVLKIHYSNLEQLDDICAKLNN